MIFLPDIDSTIPHRDIVRITYFAHDLNDAAVGRRVAMLRRGGASVTLLGFHRQERAPERVGGVVPISMGRTEDARLLRRLGAVLRATLISRRWSMHVAGADAVIARNLEMLVVASAILGQSRPRLALVYELLDVHRLLCGRGLASRLLRNFEGLLLRRCRAVIVSSPAFVREHLARYYPSRPPVLFIENKVARDGIAATAGPPDTTTAAPPWRIGWFGNLRCRKSLAHLADLAGALGDKVEIDLRGVVGVPIADLLPGVLSAHPNLRFLGPYGYPADLADIYGRVHFAWAIDYYEEGLNSAWLLPNRLYESCAFGAVPVAIDSVETGAWLRRRGLGISLASPDRMVDILSELTTEAYDRLAGAVRAAPRELFEVQPREPVELVKSIVGSRHVSSLLA